MVSPELIEQIKKGDEFAFNQLVNIWYSRIYNYAYRYSSDQEFAKEVVQKTFIQVYQKIHQLKDTSKLKSWLYRIVSNCCSSEGRLVKRKKWFASSNDMPKVRDNRTPESVYRKKEMKEIVLGTLQKIPDDQRKVIIMKEYEGLKFKEIAEVLNISENTVKSRMYYGLDAMRKILVENKMSKEIYYE